MSFWRFEIRPASKQVVVRIKCTRKINMAINATTVRRFKPDLVQIGMANRLALQVFKQETRVSLLDSLF